MSPHAHCRAKYWFGLLAVLAIVLTGTARAQTDDEPDPERHTTYCMAVLDERAQGRQDQLSDAQKLVDRLTEDGKARQLSPAEKVSLETANTVVQRATASMRHLGQSSERLRAFLLSRGRVLEGLSTGPSPALRQEVKGDIADCEQHKDLEMQAFSKCSTDCEGKDGACYLGCIGEQGPVACRKVRSCSDDEFLPF